VGPAGGLAGLKDPVQIRCLGGEHVDALVQVAVAGGQRDPSVGGEHPHVGVLAKPAQHQDRLVSGRGGAGADAGAPAPSFGDQQFGQQRGDFGGHVERGRVGDHVGSSWCRSFP
jgi:hypothetical protein